MKFNVLRASNDERKIIEINSLEELLNFQKRKEIDTSLILDFSDDEITENNFPILTIYDNYVE